MTRPTIFRGAAGITLVVAATFTLLGALPRPAASSAPAGQTRELTALSFQHEATFGGTYYRVVVSGTTAFASRGRVLDVLDVAEATAPRLLGTSPRLPEGLLVRAVGPERVYLTRRHRGRDPVEGFDELLVVDVREASAPTPAGTLRLPRFALEDVTARNTLLYAASRGAGITVLDVSDPGAPRVATQVDVGMEVTGVAWHGDRLLAAATDAQGVGWLLVLEGTQPTDLQPIGRVEVGGPTGKVFGTDGLAIVSSHTPLPGTGYTGGTAVVDLDDPTQPRVRGQLANPMLDILGFARTSDRLYVLEPQHGPRGPDFLWSYDPDQLTDAQPIFLTLTWGGAIAAVGDHVLLARGAEGLSTLRTAAAEGAIVEEHRLPTLGTPQGVALAEGLAYATDIDGELWVLDVREPAAPSVVARTALTYAYPFMEVQQAGALRVRDGRAYVARVPYDFQYGGLHLFGINDPSQPTQLGLWDPFVQQELEPAFDPYGGVTGKHPPLLFDDRLWLANGFTLTEIDVSDPTSPRFVQELERPMDYTFQPGFGDGGTATDGRRLYWAAREYGVFVVDVSTPGQATIVDRVAMPGFATDVALVGDHLLTVGHRGTGLHVHDADTLAAVRAVEDVHGGSIVVQDDTAYVTTSGSVVAFDVADPTHPVRRGTYETQLDDTYSQHAVEGDLLAIASWWRSNGIELVRLSVGEPLQEPTPGPTLTPWPTRTPGREPPRITPIPSPTPAGTTTPGSPETPAPPATPTVARPRSTPAPLYLPLVLAGLEQALATAPPSPQPPGDPQATATPPPIDTPPAAANELALRLRAAETELSFGSATDFTATFVNGTADPVMLIEPVDASTWAVRVPTYRWLVEREDGAPVRSRLIPRCGLMNPLTPDDFRTLEPGASWSIRPDAPWMTPPHWHWSFTEPGTYRVQLRYEVDKSREEPVFPAIEDLWRQAFEGVVPSTPVRVHVAPPTNEVHVERLARRHQVPIGGSRAEAEAVMGEPDQVAEGNQGETHLAYYLVDLPRDRDSLPYPRSAHIDTPRVIVTIGAVGRVSEVVLLP